VAHRARLILGGLVVTGTCRSLGRERVTLQAQQVHLTHTQVTRVGRSVWRVATAAAFSFYWYVLINKRTGLICVALGADRIARRQGPHLSESRRSMDVVAVTALDQPFIDSVVVGLREVGLGGCVTAVAELRLGDCEQVLWFLRIVWRVTIQATDIAARVR